MTSSTVYVTRFNGGVQKTTDGVYGAAETTVERCHFEGNDIMSSGGSGAGVEGK